jgi:hypothetical protein
MKDNNVIINWKVTDPQLTNKYDIEMSTDGKNFTDLGAGISTISGTGTNTQFVYSPESNFSGDLYFRIKQTDVSGSVYYSEIRSIYINNSQKQKLSLYPNPTVSGVNIRFVNKTGSEYKVELFNSYGQLIFLKNYSLSKATSINIALPDKPAPGIYFIKVTDINHHGEQVERLKIL